MSLGFKRLILNVLGATENIQRNVIQLTALVFNL